MPPRKARAKNEKYAKSGALIADRRDELGLTQQQLAAQIGPPPGVSRQRLQHWEKGKALPRPAEMAALASALRVTIDEITRGERAQGGREPPAQYDLELTPDARTIARIWADLPAAGQQYIAAQLAAMLRFQSEDPDMAAHVLTTPSAEVMRRLKDHERILEMAQTKARRAPVKPGGDEDA